MVFNLLQAPAFACHKILRLRQRHFLTRGNRIRLRYSASMAVTVLVGITVLSQGLVGQAPHETGATPQQLAENTLQDDADNSIFKLSSLADQDFFSDDSAQTQPETLKERVGGGLPDIKKILKTKGPVAMELEVERGQTLAGLLQESGISGTEAYQAVKSLSKYADPRKILPGQTLKVRMEPDSQDDNAMILTDLVMPLDVVKYVSLERRGGDFKTSLHEKELKQATRAGYTTIQTSLYGSASRSGIPAPVVAKMIRIYSWNIDFQRDIRRGDKIEVLYDVEETEDGETVKYGEILYANLTIGGREVPLYRYEMENGKVDYFDNDGNSIKKTLMKTPVDGARLSSGFGMRKHPVLGYNKMHKGVDFAAAVGTPIYAAGDGVIERIGRNGGYGNYIRIRHNNRLKTAYAHMHKFAKNLSSGSRVKQGEVIGYIGTTGRSTGPHLHYEVLLAGKQVNPHSVDLPVGEQLAGNELKKFKALASSYHKNYVSLSESLEFAEHDGGDKDKKKKS